MSFSASSSNGEYKHKLTTNEMPSHNHTTQSNLSISPQGGGTDSKAIVTYKVGTGQSGRATIVENTGGGQAHNNIPPYIVVYFWRRTV